MCPQSSSSPGVTTIFLFFMEATTFSLEMLLVIRLTSGSFSTAYLQWRPLEEALPYTCIYIFRSHHPGLIRYRPWRKKRAILCPSTTQGSIQMFHMYNKDGTRFGGKDKTPTSTSRGYQRCGGTQISSWRPPPRSYWVTPVN